MEKASPLPLLGATTQPARSQRLINKRIQSTRMAGAAAVVTNPARVFRFNRPTSLLRLPRDQSSSNNHACVLSDLTPRLAFQLGPVSHPSRCRQPSSGPSCSPSRLSDDIAPTSPRAPQTSPSRRQATQSTALQPIALQPIALQLIAWRRIYHGQPMPSRVIRAALPCFCRRPPSRRPHSCPSPLVSPWSARENFQPELPLASSRRPNGARLHLASLRRSQNLPSPSENQLLHRRRHRLCPPTSPPASPCPPSKTRNPMTCRPRNISPFLKGRAFPVRLGQRPIY